MTSYTKGHINRTLSNCYKDSRDELRANFSARLLYSFIRADNVLAGSQSDHSIAHIQAK